MKRLAFTLVLALAACGTSGAPQAPVAKAATAAFRVFGDTLAIETRGGDRAYWVGVVGRDGRAAQPRALVLESADGEITTISLAADGQPTEVLLPDGSGVRVREAGEGLLRLRGWIASGEVVVDQVVPGTLPVDAAAALQQAGRGILTVRVELLDCEGRPSEALVQRAQSATVWLYGPKALWRVPRVARRESSAFVAEFPLHPGLGDLDA